MNPISELIWNPEDEGIMPADEQMSDDCHGGNGCTCSMMDISLYGIEWC